MIAIVETIAVVMTAATDETTDTTAVLLQSL
jgi:hypothetical protein